MADISDEITWETGVSVAYGVIHGNGIVLTVRKYNSGFHHWVATITDPIGELAAYSGIEDTMDEAQDAASYAVGRELIEYSESELRRDG